MNNHRKRRLVAAMLAGIAMGFGAGACDGKDNAKKTDVSGASISVSKVCGRIFDEESVSVVKSELGTEMVREARTGESYSDDPAKAGRVLDGANGRGRVVSVCSFSGGDKGKGNLEITAEWGQGEFSDKRELADPGMATDSVVFELEEEYPLISALYVACERPDLFRAGEEQPPLKFAVTDHISLNARTRAKILQNSAHRVLEALQCRNEVTFIKPPVTVPGLK